MAVCMLASMPELMCAAAIRSVERLEELLADGTNVADIVAACLRSPSTPPASTRASGRSTPPSTGPPTVSADRWDPRAAVLLGLALNAALSWWWADPAAGYVLVCYAGREVREIFTGDH
jgi:hypothetical protein